MNRITRKSATCGKVVLATMNKGKLRELQDMLEDVNVDISNLTDYENVPYIVEDGATFFENAFKKARGIAEFTGETVIADDSGLEVGYLKGRPGVHSSRYAGPDATDKDNIRKLLEELKDVPAAQRDAAFRCVLVLFRKNGTYETFNGTLKGRIAFEPAGTGGFGYDPVFIVPSYGCTVAELAPDVKNNISHRAKALKELKKILRKEINSIRC